LGSHVHQGFLVDYIIDMAGAKKLQEVNAALAVGALRV